MNRLSKETSPYLLQHQHNPVDWYPWGMEALGRAREENKPILLSIGYSACHWCHVMERESFENREIAAFMNQSFVCIKVDREERPDLDQIYQAVAQAMTGGGGWPLTVFLTPELKPFFGGTYFPPQDRYGRPGFARVLTALADAYRNEAAAIEENSRKLTEVIGQFERIASSAPGRLPDGDSLGRIREDLLGLVDWAEGGFGSAPKFPNPMMLAFLWRSYLSRSGDDDAGEAVLLSLEKMAQGGIYDQLGGGFHRYSVDGSWSVPHFEKMLYDNALLLRLYSEVLLNAGEALAESRRELFVNVLEKTVEYLSREMRSPEGAFFAAQDADSEGEEGKYFVWDPGALRVVLSPEEAQVFSLHYGVSESGNFEHGKTVLFQSRSIEEVAAETGLQEARVVALLESACRRLRDVRARRIPPSTDTKVLASWNGLAISGLAWASQALRSLGREDRALKALSLAREAYGALVSRLSRDGSRLFSTLQAGLPKLNAYLDDYAFLAMASLDLARVEGDEVVMETLLASSEKWLEVILTHFRDPGGAGYFFTSDDHERLLQRPKTIHDQAIPAGTSVVLELCLALAEMDRGRGREAYLEEAEHQLTQLYPLAERSAFGHGELLCAALLQQAGAVIVSGQGTDRACTHPHVFRKPAGQEARAMLCHRQTCQMPTGGITELRRIAAQLAKGV